ncbi:MAG: NifU family protein [Chloroflexi bacterium]|nr:NifU family protein [Chloroflexota bacterium]
MIDITDAAQAKLLEVLAGKEDGERGLLVSIKGRGPGGFEHAMRFVTDEEKPEDVIVTQIGELTVYIEPEYADNLKGSAIDFLPEAGGFKIENPNPVFAWSDPISQAVQDVLTNEINPSVASHGGVVQLLEVKDNVAYIELGGGCVGCGLVDVTLKQGIEVAIKNAVPDILAIVDSTDHASGTNPYYQESKGGGPEFQPSKGGQAPASPFA